MKVLTITTQFANNMGALLQCYALSHFINMQKDLECEVIQYFPKHWNESWTVFHKPMCFKDVLKIVYQIFDIKSRKEGKKKNQITRTFIREMIPLNKNKYFSNRSINEKPPLADVYVCGSDQIWNFTLFNDLTYYLDFTKNIPNCRRIAYAPSIADDWTVEQGNMVRPFINNFDALSIREYGNLPSIKRVTNKEVSIVIDPVFLLGEKEWISISKVPDINEPFILCYFLSVSTLAVQTVNKMRELTGLKVVYLNHNARDKFNSEVEVRNFDPRDFVGYISRAAYVCTNSFHCTAFSIINKKNFIYIPGMRNKRVETLQEVFGLGDRFASTQKIPNLTKDDLYVDYSSGKSRGEAFIAASREYLLDAIYGRR